MSTTIRDHHRVPGRGARSPPATRSETDDVNGTWTRGHQGPELRALRELRILQYSKTPGVQMHEINVDDFVARDELNAEDAIDLARNLLAAAQWFAARETEARA